MVATVNKTYRTYEADVNLIKKQLRSLNLEHENIEDGFKIKIQRNNTLFEIEILIEERFDLEERLFMFNVYPLIHSFDDIQMNIFSKIIWKTN